MARAMWVGCVGLLLGANCAALTLGEAQGAARMGHPLDLRIPLGTAADEVVQPGCAAADVWFGATPVSPGRVTATVLPAEGSKPSAVRVQTSAVLTEPFAQVDVRLLCGHNVARSFVLLTDLRPEAPVQAPVTPPVQRSLLQPAPSVSVPLVAPPATLPATVAVKQTAKPTKPPSASPRRASPQSPDAARQMPAQGPRLKLDPVELVAGESQWQPRLQLTLMAGGAEADAPESPELTQRREAARLLWQALNTGAEQHASTSGQLEAQQTELRQLKAQLSAAEIAVQTAQAEREQLESERYTHPAFLAALLACVLAVSGWAWQRRRGTPPEKPWWGKPALTESAAPAAVNTPKRTARDWWTQLLRKRAPSPVLASGDTVRVTRSAAPLSVLDSVQGGNGGTSVFSASQMAEAQPSRSSTDFGQSLSFGAGRSVATEELFDLQQQVEFFISLGQADQAIEVLKAHLADSPMASPLAYLDLLKLYQETGQRGEYVALQKQFRRHYKGKVPAFDTPASEQLGLLAHAAVLEQLQGLWPEPGVLDLIERFIFKGEPGYEGAAFDLEAYRELLLLYGIARDVIEGRSADSMFSPLAGAAFSAESNTSAMSLRDELPSAFASSMPAVLPEDAPPALATPPFAPVPAAVPAQPTAPVSHALDLDLNLDEFTASLPPDHSPEAAFVIKSAPTSVRPDAALVSKSSPLPSLDLDFSALDDPEAFVIKKSGTPQ